MSAMALLLFGCLARNTYASGIVALGLYLYYDSVPENNGENRFRGVHGCTIGRGEERNKRRIRQRVTTTSEGTNVNKHSALYSAIVEGIVFINY
ncbi:hypothetical protein EDB87DRAFT_1655394 [Lactarius vividus]|nr:hypothetical protein EDB87DRAFT_1655394 [Lactarius vividus]